MPNNKTYRINAEFAINRAVWRTLGYGDQPSKVEVGELLESFLSSYGTDPSVKLRYMGAPGHYKATMFITVEQPWWRRAGFGDSSSVFEVKIAVGDFIARISRRNLWLVTATIEKNKAA